ncbi:MAG: hypothetical protein ACI4A5_08615 [Hominilimicola sp.]
MELRTEKLMELVKKKYPEFTTEQVIALVQAEALICIAAEISRR